MIEYDSIDYGNILDDFDFKLEGLKFQIIYSRVTLPVSFIQIEDKKLLDLLCPKEFINDMLSIGMLECITDNYGFDCNKLCRNSVAWILNRIKETIWFKELSVVEGLFLGRDHCWLQINNELYLDLTLAQFVSNAPNIAVVKISECERYFTPTTIYPSKEIDQWLIEQL